MRAVLPTHLELPFRRMGATSPRYRGLADSVHGMAKGGRVKAIDAVVLRGGVEIQNPLEAALEFVEAYSAYDSHDPRTPHKFDESDLRLANRGGARISAAEIAAILERRGGIERALRSIDPAGALLFDASSRIV